MARNGAASQATILWKAKAFTWYISRYEERPLTLCGSAVAGKAGYGGKNGWQLIDPTVAIDTESDLLLGGNGIDLDGVTQFPICGEDEIFKNWNTGSILANYPCNWGT